MPTQTFYNLTDDKQKRIIAAAKKEFNEKTLADASIARIVEESNISRGSFYQYFEGKNELFFYIIGIFRDKYHQTIIQSFEDNDGDFFNAVKSFGNEYISDILTSDQFGLFKNIHRYMGEHINRVYGYHPDQLEYPDIGNPKVENEFIKRVNLNNLRIQEDDELVDIFKFLIDILNDTIMEGRWREFTVEQTQKNFQKRLEWVFFGIIKEDNRIGDE